MESKIMSSEVQLTNNEVDKSTLKLFDVLKTKALKGTEQNRRLLNSFLTELSRAIGKTEYYSN